MDRNVRVRIFASLVSLVAGLQGLFRHPEDTILNPALLLLGVALIIQAGWLTWKRDRA